MSRVIEGRKRNFLFYRNARRDPNTGYFAGVESNGK